MGRYRAGLALRLLSATAILSLAVLAGCSGFGLFGSSGGTGVKQEVGEVIWRSRDQQFVRLESQDVPKGRAMVPNSHPVTITKGRIRSALARIEVRLEQDEDPTPVFNKYQLKVMSEALEEGLAKARPGQDVTFALVGFHRGGLIEFLNEPKLTTGRVFYAGNQLNLIFGEVHRRENPGLSTGAGRIDPDPRLHPNVPGMRSITRRHEWQLVAPPGSGIHRPPGTNRSDWLVFTPRALTAAPARQATRQGTGAPAAAAASEVEQLRRELEQLRREVRGGAGAPGYSYPSTAPAQPAQTYSPPAQTYSPAPTAQVPGSADPSLRQRLIVLEDLWNRGLISDEEYQAKRQRILSGF